MPIQIVLTHPRNNQSSANFVQLVVDNWDDYSYKTLFTAYIHDTQGIEHKIGSVKIGYASQPHGRTRDILDNLSKPISELPENFFSLGQDPEYYENLMKLPVELRSEYLQCMRDIVADRDREATAKQHDVYSTSLLRSVSRSAIDGQFRRILAGGAVLTEYHFYYTSQFGSINGPMKLGFEVKPNSLPPTNVHVIIGRNGVGKTTLLNSIVQAIVQRQAVTSVGSFEISDEAQYSHVPMPEDYFSSLTSVAFSAFDPFTPPPDQPDPSQGIRYFYIGLKTRGTNTSNGDVTLKAPSELVGEFISSLNLCLSTETKCQQWRKAISSLEFDENFAEMHLSQLADDPTNNGSINSQASQLFSRMSSGHKIVLLTVTRLVETVEEKSLVLLDEPESHLHPPLLSAFTRALSELLIARNAVALIATHSPVIVQEVPKSCVWKIRRYRSTTTADRPEIETFGENVGSLTREIFGLEVSKSGFHDMLAKAADKGDLFEDILTAYGDQIGLEGQSVLRALLASRGA